MYYQRVWSHFKLFLSTVLHQPPSLPILHLQLVLYIASLAKDGYSPATITSYMSALSFLHKLHHLPDPTTSFVVTKMLKGYRKLAPPPSVRLPITLIILQQLLNALPFILHSAYEIALYKSMYSLAFYACLRIGEITSKSSLLDHNLQLSDVQFISYRNQWQHDILITFRSFKHSTPHKIHQLQVQDSQPIKPVSLLSAFLKHRGPKHGPLFMWQDSHPVSYNQFVSTLRDALRFTGHSTTDYTSHSFRIGRATLAMEQGFSDLQIMKLGRWSSSAHLKYLRPASLSS